MHKVCFAFLHHSVWVFQWCGVTHSIAVLKTQSKLMQQYKTCSANWRLPFSMTCPVCRHSGCYFLGPGDTRLDPGAGRVCEVLYGSKCFSCCSAPSIFRHWVWIWNTQPLQLHASHLLQGKISNHMFIREIRQIIIRYVYHNTPGKVWVSLTWFVL